MLSILSLLTKHTFVVAQMVIYQPSFQEVTLHLTLTYTGCEPAETQTVSKKRRMAWTTLFNQEFVARNCQESNEGKTISDT